jgi:hypothetical protein
MTSPRNAVEGIAPGRYLKSKAGSPTEACSKSATKHRRPEPGVLEQVQISVQKGCSAGIKENPIGEVAKPPDLADVLWGNELGESEPDGVRAGLRLWPEGSNSCGKGGVQYPGPVQRSQTAAEIIGELSAGHIGQLRSSDGLSRHTPGHQNRRSRGRGH